MKLKKLFIVLAFSMLGIGAMAQSDIDLSTFKTDKLDGAYSVVSVLDDGQTQQFNAKFQNGKLISVALDGQEIPKDQWVKHEKLIKEYMGYLASSKNKTYKYEAVYDIEEDIRKELKRLESDLKRLELEKKMNDFYQNELKVWLDNLERELDESEVVDEIDDVLNEVMSELEQFLVERKKYRKEIK